MDTRQLIRLMRPGDWVKNAFVLPALVFSQKLNEPTAVAQTAVAFVAFCLLSSGSYAINDVIDAESDRRHPIKRHRPVAAGAVSKRAAIALGAVLVLAGLGLGFLVNFALGSTLLLYALMQVAYNAGLKRVLLVDVVTVAVGFGLRAAAGAVAIEVQLSIWLLLCVFFLTLYLGFIKRLCDIASAERTGEGTWRSSAGYDSRIELNWLLGVSAVLAVVTYLMYALSGHAWAIFGARSLGFALLSPLVLITIHRFYRRASTGTSDSPLAALREDRVVLVSILLYGLGVLATLYLPFVERILKELFVAGVEAAPI